ncbi:kinase domain protein, partial [Novosphingobium sp. PY1]
TYPDSPAKNGGWKVKTIGASSTAQKPHGSPEAGVGGENDRRGPRKRQAAPGGAK